MNQSQARKAILDVAYALRREGVKIIKSNASRYPTMIVLCPSERLRAKSVEVKTKCNGIEQTWNVANESGVSVYW